MRLKQSKVKIIPIQRCIVYLSTALKTSFFPPHQEHGPRISGSISETVGGALVDGFLVKH